jgi:GxxExxY protein
MEVHRELGPGLDEADYERALHLELLALGIEHECQVPLPLFYKGAKLDCGYRMDLVIRGSLLLELKSLEKLHPVHEAQLLTYLRLAKLKLGLLMNFNVLLLRDGITRRANTRAAVWEGHPSNVDSTSFDDLSRQVIDAALEVQTRGVSPTASAGESAVMVRACPTATKGEPNGLWEVERAKVRDYSSMPSAGLQRFPGL